MSASIDPWGPTIVPTTPEPLLAALWRHRRTIRERWPFLPLPTYAPALTHPLYGRAAGLAAKDVPVNSGAPAGPGPDVHAAALITVWEQWPYAYGPCHTCRDAMVATFWGGIMGVGTVMGVCTTCFTRGGRFLPGVCAALFPIQRLLDGLPYQLPWTPLAFRLGGPAPALRAVLSELGEAELGGIELTPYDGAH